MAKFHGKIGYSEIKETVPGTSGVWAPDTVERSYTGDIIKNTSSWKEHSADDAGGSSQLNDDLKINNRISVLADPYAYEHFHSIKYVIFMGIKWRVTNVEVSYPRLILSLGGVYNGN
jgi:hypothetical protein